MSMPSKVSITCAKCNNEQEYTAWSSINVTNDPELKRRFLAGELTSFRCNSCNTTTNVAYDLLYHDMDKPLMIWLKHGEGIDEKTNSISDALVGNYSLRLVHSMNELVEKVRIFEDNQNDKFIELLKIIISLDQNRHTNTLLFYDRLMKNDNKYTVVITEPVEGGSNEHQVPLDKASKVIKEFFSSASEDIELSEGKWLNINRQYAEKVLNKSHANRSKE